MSRPYLPILLLSLSAVVGLAAADLPMDVVVVNAPAAVLGSSGALGKVVKAAARFDREAKWKLRGSTIDKLGDELEGAWAIVVWNAQAELPDASRETALAAGKKGKLPVIFVHADWNEPLPENLRFPPGSLKQTTSLAGWRKRAWPEDDKDFARKKWVKEDGSLDRDGEELLVEAVAWQLGIPIGFSPTMKAFVDQAKRIKPPSTLVLQGGGWVLGKLTPKLPVSAETMLPRNYEALGRQMEVSVRTDREGKPLQLAQLARKVNWDKGGALKKPINLCLGTRWASKSATGLTAFIVCPDGWLVAGSGKGKKPKKPKKPPKNQPAGDAGKLLATLMADTARFKVKTVWIGLAPADAKALLGGRLDPAAVTAFNHKQEQLAAKVPTAIYVELPPSGATGRAAVLVHVERCLCAILKLPFRPDPMIDMYRQN